MADNCDTEEAVINAARDLIVFAKMNEYPEQHSPAFILLTMLVDNLETTLAKAGHLKLPLKSDGPDMTDFRRRWPIVP